MEWRVDASCKTETEKLRESTRHVKPRTERSRRGASKSLENSLVSKTRPGYKTFSRSFSATPTEVAVVWTGTEVAVDGAPSRLDNAGVGLGCPWLLAGHVPGDAGLVRESICSHDVSKKRHTITWPDLCL